MIELTRAFSSVAANSSGSNCEPMPCDELAGVKVEVNLAKAQINLAHTNLLFSHPFSIFKTKAAALGFCAGSFTFSPAASRDHCTTSFDPNSPTCLIVAG